MAIALSHSLEQPILLVNWSLRSLNRNLFPVRMTETMKQLHLLSSTNLWVILKHQSIVETQQTLRSRELERKLSLRLDSTTADEFWAMSMADPLTASLQDEKLFEKLVQNAAARLATFHRSDRKIWLEDLDDILKWSLIQSRESNLSFRSKSK